MLYCEWDWRMKCNYGLGDMKKKCYTNYPPKKIECCN